MASDLTKKVGDRLDDIVEEETKRKYGELNVVTEVAETTGGSFRITFQPLSAYSPLAVGMGKSIRDAALSVDGVKAVRVECGGHLSDELVNRIVNNDELRPKKRK